MVTDYRYDAQGTRRAKYSRVYGETLYADRMYQEHLDATSAGLATKHIFVGQTRIASKLHYTDQTPSTRALYMTQNTFWYHPDHLGSTNWVTDAQGAGYEHFTYTPYGEAWVEEHLSSKIHRMSHRFTGQEFDPETGLYAFPARNYDPRTSRWLSADPALEEYLPEPGQKPGDLVGMGGVYNYANLAVYHYGGNNPLKYVDPTGEFVVTLSILAYSAAGLLVLALANYASKNSDELAYAVEQAGNNASESLQNTVDNIVAHAQNKPKENEANGAQTGEGAKAGASGGSASPDPDQDPDDDNRISDQARNTEQHIRKNGRAPDGHRGGNSSETLKGNYLLQTQTETRYDIANGT